MKLNITQWNTVLNALKEKEEIKKNALELADRLYKEAESNYKKAYEAEDWDQYDKIRGAASDLERNRRKQAADLQDLQVIIATLENQEI